MAKQLEQKYRVVALDARGHGHSSIVAGDDAYDWQLMINDLTAVTNQFLDGSSEDQIELIAGSSPGAIIGAVAAAREPELYRHVVLDAFASSDVQILDRICSPRVESIRS